MRLFQHKHFLVFLTINLQIVRLRNLTTRKTQSKVGRRAKLQTWTNNIELFYRLEITKGRKGRRTIDRFSLERKNWLRAQPKVGKTAKEAPKEALKQNSNLENSAAPRIKEIRAANKKPPFWQTPYKTGGALWCAANLEPGERSARAKKKC